MYIHCVVKSFRAFVLCCLVPFCGEGQRFEAYDQTLPGSAVRIKMIPIQGGAFQIGSPLSKESDETPAKKVVVSSFWMAEHETTFAAWDTFFKRNEVPQTKAIAVDAVSRPTAQYIDLTWGMGRNANHPTNSMSQAAAIMYCKWLYEQTGIFYRLPTEAEWEYACKAGSTGESQAGYSEVNSGGKFQLVKQLKPNAWGLYDMLGNLSEWTLDQYDPAAYAAWKDQVKDPTTPVSAKYPRVVKGGSYMDPVRDLRCANRIPSSPDWNKRDPQIPKSRWWLTDGMFVGFRVVRPLQQPSREEIEAFYAKYLK